MVARPIRGPRSSVSDVPYRTDTLEQAWPGRSLPDVPRAYVLCTEDQIIPPARQREMAARLGVEPIEIASEHAVFTFRPRELAAVLAG